MDHRDTSHFVDGEDAPEENRIRDREIDFRLSTALGEAGRSVLGMPGTVETFKAMLERHGLALVLNGARR